MENQDTPILHSMNRDTVTGAKKSVGSSNLPEEEALLLAKMQSENSKKRKFNFITMLSLAVLAVSVSMILIPDKYFIKKDTGVNVAQTSKNFLNTNYSYQINKPTSSELEDFRNKNFAQITGIADIEIIDQNKKVFFAELAPFVADRFISSIIPAVVTNYIYGFVGVGDSSLPYLVLVTENQNLASTIMSESERTLYTDFLTIMKLPNSTQNELLGFENYDSVRTPVRYLRALNGDTLLVYGFPMDNVLLVTNSIPAYETIRDRMLLGY